MKCAHGPTYRGYGIQEGTCRCRVLYHIDSRRYHLKKLEDFMTVVPVLCVHKNTQRTHLNGEKNDNTS